MNEMDERALVETVTNLVEQVNRLAELMDMQQQQILELQEAVYEDDEQ